MNTYSRAEETTDTDTTREAFSQLRPIRDDYALAPIDQGFNWDECAAGIAMPALYLVVFRSVRRADADIERLRWFDDRAYEDAKQAPGFLFYFKGQITPDRYCLSFCLWATRHQARSATARPAHTDAAALVAKMYESYDLECYMLRQLEGTLVFERLSR